MNVVFTDLHIHTSENADILNDNYNVDMLISKMRGYSKHDVILISITDHNTINKEVYKKIIENHSDISILLGVELHIRNFETEDPYHCHIYFDLTKNEIMDHVDEINSILDSLYPKKMVVPSDDIPYLEDIAKAFDTFDYLMLPHGGQSHRTFDKTIPEDKKFDTIIERNIYYNQFDGFTSRSNKGLDRTQKYFKKLGILSFVNLITCSDNYNPNIYPSTKADNTESFVPTWLISEATFSGLRLALSESSRLVYQNEKPIFDTEHIKSVILKNQFLDIDVKLTQGLNVIIGGSSSGKTLFMDSLYKKMYDTFETEESSYSKFDVKDLNVDNPASYKPHYISQNYITKVIDEKYEEGIDKIDIIKNTFSGNEELDKRADQTLLELKAEINILIAAVSEIESLQDNLSKIPAFPRIVAIDSLDDNPFEKIKPTSSEEVSLKIDSQDLTRFYRTLDEISELSKSNPFMKDITEYILKIKEELGIANKKFLLSKKIITEIDFYKNEFDSKEAEGKQSELDRKKSRETLITVIRKYVSALKRFDTSLSAISKFSFDYKTDEIKSHGHTLFIENKFKLNKQVFLNSLNYLLKTPSKIKSFDEIVPESLFSKNFSERNPKVKDYNEFQSKLYSKISEENVKKYRIIDRERRDFNSLSPGWRTAVILDIVLGYEDDVAPIFIDQPEDNLATNYINYGLVESIKKSKNKRQILIISHNATIPMLADAQNIIFCKNKDGLITIRSSSLEGNLDNKSIIDHIVEITDGGKASVKKRVKKYNLKKFREDDNNENNY